MSMSENELVWHLYRQMFFCRQFENAIAELWHNGDISGEMHLGTGEEGIVAGVVSQLQEGDALALDHRSTAAMLLHGVDPVRVLQEICGHPDGLSKGQAGHLHLMSKAHLAASSGIVGASGPAGTGFALAAQMLRPGSVAVAFFGEGALNQGMLMESFNLAVEWRLPVIFVCKDDSWAITTKTDETSPVVPVERAAGFGLPVYTVDGNDVEAVYQTAQQAIERTRQGGGPVFIHATCTHFEGHMIDVQLVRVGRKPLREGIALVWPILKALFSPGGSKFSQRWAAVLDLITTIFRSRREHHAHPQEPVAYLRQKLSVQDSDRLTQLEAEVVEQIEQVVVSALRPATGQEVQA
jgi:pyruvate dehydrogenase E1 component alpha subunit